MAHLKKMDEMEMQISLKSIQASWFYTVIFLFIWSVYDYFTKSHNGLPCFLLITENLVFLGTQFILKRKYNK
jgi:ABC-type xylose transport system permease subunit